MNNQVIKNLGVTSGNRNSFLNFQLNPAFEKTSH